MHQLDRLLAAACLMLWYGTLAAAQDFPSRPITMVVPFAAGGGTDILARLSAKYLERLGKPLHVENRPGGGGVVASASVKGAEADGHTLLMAPSGILAVNPVMMKAPSYDPATDFAPVALVAGTPFVLLITSTLPVYTLADFVTYAKSLGKPIPMATAGPGTPHHLFPEMLKGTLGIEVTYVPYRGSAPALADLVAGHITAMFCDLGPSSQLIRDGKVRAIAVSTKQRLAAFPHVPSLHESGAHGFDAASWQMVVAPAKTPVVTIAKLHGVLAPALASEEAQQLIATLGFSSVPSLSPSELRGFLASEIARWGSVVRKAGIAGSL